MSVMHTCGLLCFATTRPVLWETDRLSTHTMLTTAPKASNLEQIVLIIIDFYSKHLCQWRSYLFC